MFTLHPAWRVRPRPMALFFTGLVVIMAVLVIRDPWFGFFAPAGYTYAFSVLRWPWRLAGVSAVAVVAATAQTGGVHRITPFGVIVYGWPSSASTCSPSAVSPGSDWKDDNQKEERERALAEVREANRRLEATLAENAGLHEQLLTQAREAGILDERQRMAGEIHDTLAQGLTGIITQLQAAEQASGDQARLAQARVRRDQAGPGEPVRGPAIGGRAASRAPGAGSCSATRWPAWPSAGRRCTGSRSRSRPRARPGRVPRTLSSRCCARRRRRWPTWPSTPGRPGSG